MHTIFVTDLHGHTEKYFKLLDAVLTKKPKILFIAGDLSNHIKKYSQEPGENFYTDFLQNQFSKLRKKLKDEYPEVFIIMGNDDPRVEESALQEGEVKELWHYVHSKTFTCYGYKIYGYSFCPPSPFQLKDWEKYDVSRYVDPGCISPEEGFRTVEIPFNGNKYSTIEKDLKELVIETDLSKSIFLFHTPPYKTNLDRAALDNKMIDHVPVDVHVGSIAVKKFIKAKQPYLTLHGHIHESTRLTGSWKDEIGNTLCFNAAHDGKELAIIEFDLDDLPNAKRILY